jgi:transcriptional regulator with XRE-family HTH domain
MLHETKFPLIKAHFARRLKELRVAHGLKRGTPLNQKELADQIGVSRRVYIDWENPTKTNAVPTDINKLIALCEILDTDLIYLCTGLFDGQKERKHQDNYVNVYSRYSQNPDFYLMVNFLMRWDDEVLKKMTAYFESLTDFYEGQPLIK